MRLLSVFLRHSSVFFTNSTVISTAPKCLILVWKKPFCFYYCGLFHCTSVNIPNSFSQCNDLTSKGNSAGSWKQNIWRHLIYTLWYFWRFPFPSSLVLVPVGKSCFILSRIQMSLLEQAWLCNCIHAVPSNNFLAEKSSLISLGDLLTSFFSCSYKTRVTKLINTF